MTRIFVLSLLCALGFLGLAGAQTKGQTENDLPKSLDAAFGRYELNLPKDQPPGLDFEFFRLYRLPQQASVALKRNGRVQISGSLVTKDGIYYPFLTAYFKTRATGEYEEVEFLTSRIKGVSYRFKGKFLDKITPEKRGGPQSDMRGIIIRDQRGKVTASKALPFTAYPEL